MKQHYIRCTVYSNNHDKVTGYHYHFIAEDGSSLFSAYFPDPYDQPTLLSYNVADSPERRVYHAGTECDYNAATAIKGFFLARLSEFKNQHNRNFEPTPTPLSNINRRGVIETHYDLAVINPDNIGKLRAACFQSVQGHEIYLATNQLADERSSEMA